MSRWLLLLTACQNPSWDTCDEPVPTAEGNPTWHGETRAIVEQRCARCHVDGGLAPFPMQSYDDVVAIGELIRATVSSGTMPPWHASSCCQDYLYDWDLSHDDASTLLAWFDNDMPEGEPAAYTPRDPVSVGLPRVDRTLTMDEPFLPDLPAGATDASWCFLLDWPEDEATYVTGMSLRPGNAKIVHHALVLVAGPAVVAGFEAQDALSPSPGWSCPGGVVLGTTGWLGGWSPGWEGVELPDGLGHEVKPGSKIILSVHYSVLDAGEEPDQTSIDLMLEDRVEAELGGVNVFDPTWLLGGMRIGANEPDVLHSHKQRPTLIPNGSKLRAVNLHMHERGSHGQVGIEHKDGTTTCLLQIEDWDYNWQNDFWFADPPELQAGDKLFVECHWDNTAGNQKVVGGSVETPRDLNWAEDEEMCVAAVTFER